MIVKQFLTRFLPGFLFTPLRQTKRWFDRQRRQYQRRFQPAVDRQKLLVDLRLLGIQPGDIVLVHSALSSLGNVVGGADTVIDCLLEVVGDQGTLLMPALTTGGGALRKLQKNELFDYRSTPTTLGVINETFRKRPGVLRSIHPTHSVCGIGPLAKKLLMDNERSQTPCGPLSPFSKLVDVDGKILILGSPFSHLTSVHVIEDRVKFPFEVYYPEIFQARVIGRDGRETTMPSLAHDPVVSRTRIDCNPSKEQEILRYGLNGGYIEQGRAGAATCYLMRAAALEQLLDELLAKGITIYQREDPITG